MTFRRILIVDEDLATRETLTEALQQLGYCVSVSARGEEALSRLGAEPADLVIAGLRLSGMDACEFSKQVTERNPDLPVIVCGPQGATEVIGDALECGAVDFLLKPVNAHALKLVLGRIMQRTKLEAELLHMRREFAGPDSTSMVVESTGMVEVLRSATRSARAEGNILICGEGGTGKTQLAKFTHQASACADGPFVILDCSALSEDLLESELFGHERGAFTGAQERRIGSLELAAGGTLVLKAIDAASRSVQRRLLRAIQQGCFVRLGGSTEVPMEARLMAMTQQDLAALVAEGCFGEQLYYELHQLPLNVPPLRERVADIAGLSRNILENWSRQTQRPVPELTDEAVQELIKRPWPGNLDELGACLEEAARRADDGLILAEHLQSSSAHTGTAEVATSLDLEHEVVQNAVASQKMADVERVTILATLKQTRGNKTEAARRLGLTARTLSNKMKLWRQLGYVA